MRIAGDDRRRGRAVNRRPRFGIEHDYYNLDLEGALSSGLREA